MSLPDVRPQANLLSEFALATLSAFGIWACRLRSRSSGSVPDLDAVGRRNNSPAHALMDCCRLTSTHRVVVRPECGQIFGHL